MTVLHHSLQKLVQENVLKRKKKKKKEFQLGMLQFLPTLAWKKTFSQVLIYKSSVTRLAAGFHLFTSGICRAKLANYGFYWTKLSLFLVLIGWDDLIRLLYKSILLENRGASYLQSNPGSKLGGSFFRVSATDISVVIPRITKAVYCHYSMWNGQRNNKVNWKEGHKTDWWVPQVTAVEIQTQRDVSQALLELNLRGWTAAT